MLKLTYITSRFERSHGHAPKGRGVWGFAGYACGPEGEPIFAPRAMTLTEAKKWLKVWLRDQEVEGEFEVYILP